MYRKNQTTSSYAAEFGYMGKDLKPQNNVFKYKKCSEVITKSYLVFKY